MEKIDYKRKALKYKHKYLTLQQTLDGGRLYLNEIIYNKETIVHAKEKLIQLLNAKILTHEKLIKLKDNSEPLSKEKKILEELISEKILEKEEKRIEINNLYHDYVEIILNKYKSFKSDMNVILPIVINHGKLIQFIDEKFKDDITIVNFAITNDAEAYKFISEKKKRFTFFRKCNKNKFKINRISPPSR